MTKIVNKLRAWKRLERHAKKMKKIKMRDLFAEDNDRAAKFGLQLESLLFDFSKNIISEKTILYLLKLAQDRQVSEKIEAMFSGEKINFTENRAVLHTALRNTSNNPVFVDGKDVMPKIKEVLAKMRRFTEDVRLGKILGQTGKKLTNIVNIGIGGSDLGPVMAVEALKKYKSKDINTYFISNIDGTACAEVLNRLNPETTLFIVASKTFTTIETLTNAKTCRKWLVDALGEHAVAKHFVALSTNAEKVKEFGIDTKNMFEFWDFVGGRYSMWSAIGLSIAIAIGMDNFEKMLEGAHTMDLHFRHTELKSNIPVMLALISIWNNNFLGWRTQAIIPYDQYLKYLPAYLQQLEMESNGKFVSKENEFVKYNTGTAIFGGSGTDVQHSFFQMLHQGTTPIPVDFIIPAISHNEIGNHHEILIANVLAQSEALMRGKTVKEVAAEMEKAGKSKEEIEALKKYKSFPGNNPSNTIIVKKIDPYTLGMLVAMYEHKVFVQGIIWDINSFDQFGVELGKQMALKILPEIQGNESTIMHDSSTASLIRYIKNIRK